MIDLLEMNKQMLRDGKYNVADTRVLSKITGLQNPNDYDKYQIVCALCNYDLPELTELRDLRMHYFQIVSSSGIDYSHKDSDYAKVQSGIRCVNTGEINKYGHLTFEINASAPSLVNELWRYHSKDCLKYVDSKSVPGKVVVSVSKDQFESFRAMLDKMNVDYDKKNLEKNVIFSFIGANIDAEEYAKNLNIDNVMQFTQDEEGMKQMWAKERRGKMRSMARMSFGCAFDDSFKLTLMNHGLPMSRLRS